MGFRDVSAGSRWPEVCPLSYWYLLSSLEFEYDTQIIPNEDPKWNLEQWVCAPDGLGYDSSVSGCHFFPRKLRQNVTQSVLRKCDSTFRQSGTDNTADALQEYLGFKTVYMILLLLQIFLAFTMTTVADNRTMYAIWVCISWSCEGG